MHTYLFFLGTAHELSYKELQVVLGSRNLDVKKLNDQYASSQIEEENFDPQELIDLLGGTVKIAKKISSSVDNPSQEISEILLKQEGKVTFSIHGSGDENINGSIKSILQKNEKSSRFVHIKHRLETAYHQRKTIFEFFIYNEVELKGIYQVVAAQEIKNWKIRDYKRPRIDPRSGMLPPKVARIMINLAIPDQKPSVVLDPFCGSGTILAEALMLGHQVIGADISQKAVDDSKKNIEWLKEGYQIDSFSHIFARDVAHLKKDDLQGKNIDAVVYEPYMGPINIREEKIKDIVRGLQKLYKGALKNVGKLIEPGAKVVAIFPQIKVGSTVKSTGDLIDSCENFGYTRLAGPISYSRPNSVVIRKIYILEKK